MNRRDVNREKRIAGKSTLVNCGRGFGGESAIVCGWLRNMNQFPPSFDSVSVGLFSSISISLALGGCGCVNCRRRR